MADRYTPGPWKYVPTAGSSVAFYIKSRYVIAGVEDTDDIREARNNARLMAAAPELLEALKHAVDWLNAAGVAESMPVQQQARAALAKAEGRASPSETPE